MKRHGRIALGGAGAIGLAVAALAATGSLSGGGGATKTTARTTATVAAAPTLAPFRSGTYLANVPALWNNSHRVNGADQVDTWTEPGSAGASVLIDEIPGGTSTPQERAAHVRNSQANATKVGFHSGKLAGRPAWVWEYTQGGRHKVDYFVNSCSDVYAILGSASPTRFGALSITFRHVAESVKARGCPTP